MAYGFMPDIVTERDLIFAFFVDEVAFFSVPVGHIPKLEWELIGLSLTRFDDIGLLESKEAMPCFFDTTGVWGVIVDFDDVFAGDFASVLDRDGDFAFTLLLVDFLSGDPLLEGGVGFAFTKGEENFVVVVLIAIGHSAGDVIPITDIDTFGILNEFLAVILVAEG